MEKHDPLKIQLLTIVPDNWSVRKIVKEFNTSQWLAAESKHLKKSNEVSGKVSEKKGKTLSDEIVNKIKSFYNMNDNSRIKAGMSDTVLMGIDGEKRRVQKRLLLYSLNDLYRHFKTFNPKIQVSFSMFAKLRPKNCILPGQSGTHSVCVCTIHQNVKMMTDAINLEKLTQENAEKLIDYKDFLKKINCSAPTESCYLNECKKCPGINMFQAYLQKLLLDSSIYEVTYGIWTETDRSTLLTVTESVTDFVETFSEKLKKLNPHSYVTKKQTEFIKSRQLNLSPTEVMVNFDFSENYSYVVQDAAQSFHFNNDQCTVFPVLFYYKDNSQVTHKSCVFLSECNKHDTAAVFTVLQQLIPEIKKHVPKVKKIIYITDGAKQHFKNRYQTTNLKNHKEDFYLDAEWHFTTPAHGKGRIDGVGASFKREVRRYSLKAKPTNAILNIDRIVAWAKNHYTKDLKIFYFFQADKD